MGRGVKEYAPRYVVGPILVSASGNPNSNYLDGRVELVIHPLVSNRS